MCRVLIDQIDALVTVRLCLTARRLSFSRQNRHEFGPVVIPGKKIQNRVDAAVDARQRPGDLVGEVDDVEEVTVEI